MGVNIMSSEQAPARRAGGERPRMMFGRRVGSADLTWIEPEAAIMSWFEVVA